MEYIVRVGILLLASDNAFEGRERMVTDRMFHFSKIGI